MFKKFNYLVFTLFNIGKLPASGTFGSIFAVIFYIIFYNFLPILGFIIIILVTFFYSLIFLQRTLSSFSNEDPKEIVIDEFIGQLLPLIICNGNLSLILLSFLTFRFFDISKLFPANIFDKKIKGPLGIIGDDVVAGIYSFITIYLTKLYIWQLKKLLKS